MKINIGYIKVKILEETKKERDEIHTIDTKYSQMYHEKGKRRKRIVYYICLIVSIYLFPVVIGWITWYMIPMSIVMLVVGFVSVDHKFMQYCSTEIMNEDENLVSLKKTISEKKNKILREDENMIQYSRYLKSETIKSVLNEYDFYSAGTRKYQKDENERERRKLINQIDSSFPGSKSLLGFNRSFNDLKFNFSREYCFSWGPGLVYKKICKVNMYEDCDQISFHSHSY